eukprot:SAG11_NODE_13116_length_669_cov_1.256140_1_plen_67_part_10
MVTVTATAFPAQNAELSQLSQPSPPDDVYVAHNDATLPMAPATAVAYSVDDGAMPAANATAIIESPA